MGAAGLAATENGKTGTGECMEEENRNPEKREKIWEESVEKSGKVCYSKRYAKNWY